MTTPLTASGTIYYVFDGGFSMTTSHGYFDAFTTSTTTYVGAKPYVGETVSAAGTGSWSTSINATTVTQTGATAPSSTATPPAVSGTVLWQAGSATLGKWVVANTYQCGTPVQSGADFTFNLERNGTSCGRNQLNPVTSSGAISQLTPGQTYTWTFNYIDGTPSGAGPGMGSDSDARSLIWQIHTDQGTTYGNCMQLGFDNSGSTQQWYFYGTCSGDSAAFAMPYKPGETDSFKIVARVDDSASGTTTLYRNGALVGTITGPNFNDTAGYNPWWNFGPYKWRWELSGGGGSDMTTVNATIEDMTLTQN